MFRYFQNYSWNMALMMASQLGGHLSEIDEASKEVRIREAVGDAQDEGLVSDWIDGWLRVAARLKDLAKDDEATGNLYAAGSKFRRAAIYFLSAERLSRHSDARKHTAYEELLACFEKGVVLRREPCEWVNIPYNNVYLPALFVPAHSNRPQSPCVIHFDGFDVTKEWTYLSGLTDELRLRGISSLVVDHPGIGGALRKLGLVASRYSEQWATAAIDFLEKKSGVDAKRIGLEAMSLGGYYSIRAAAYEPRITAAAAWGARFDNAQSHGRILKDSSRARSVPYWIEHAKWVYGSQNVDELFDIISSMNLRDCIDKVRCPILVMQGENDRQVPIEQAHQTVELAINSRQRDLRIFTARDGSVEHCGADNFSIQIDYMAGWFERTLFNHHDHNQ